MQRIIFDSSALAGEERSRKDLWISTLSSGYVRLNADPAANRPFQGQLKIAVIDKTSVGTIYGTVKTIARSAREVAAENTDNVVLLCNSGTRRICIEQKGVAIDLDAGDPVLIEQCAPSWIRVDHANCNLLAIQAPRAHVAALLPELNDRFMAKVKMTAVPYKGAAPAISDLLGGQIDVMFTTVASAASLVAAGQLRALAVTSTERSAAFPQLPTIAEAGVPGYAAESWYGLYAPAKTPAPVIARLNQAVAKAVKSGGFKQLEANEGLIMSDAVATFEDFASQAHRLAEPSLCTAVETAG